MPSKLEYYAQMADAAARQVTGSYGDWTAFLQTAARLYKYPYHEQLMIYAQRPEATACAEYDLWNQRMGRYVRRGSKGIALIDTSKPEPTLKYVFDVSDTDGKENARSPYLWQYRPGHEEPVSQALEDRFEVPNQVGLAEQISTIATSRIEDYWTDNEEEILDILAGSFLSEYDEADARAAFRAAARSSITYTILSRCGLDPEEVLSYEDFLDVFDFNSPDTAAVLGTAVSNISQEILRQIEITIKTYERQKLAERSSHNDRTQLYEERGLPDPQPDPAIDHASEPRQVRPDAESVSAGAPASDLESPDSLGEAVPPLAGDRGDSKPAAEPDDAPAYEAERGDGGPESNGPDEMGRPDEQPEGPGRGNDPEGTGFRLTQAPFGQEITGIQQDDLFPSEKEQIELITAAELLQTESPAAFVSLEELDHILRLGSNSEHSRQHVAVEVSKGKSPEELAQFLQKEYHGGFGFRTDTGSVAAWYDEDGIHITHAETARYSQSAQIVPWERAAERVSTLLEAGQFATNVELEESSYRERLELSQWLFYLNLEIDSTIEDCLPCLWEYTRMGYEEGADHLAKRLEDPTFLQTLQMEYREFRILLADNPKLLRSHYTNTRDIGNRLEELSLPRMEFQSELTEVPTVQIYITQDEINQALADGSLMAGGKDRIAAFFSEPHTRQEQAAFLKQEYGIGGKSSGVSNSWKSYSEHNGKGITLTKEGCAKVELSWTKAADRIQELVTKDRYFTAAEKAEREAAARAKAREQNEDVSTSVEAVTDAKTPEEIVEPEPLSQLRPPIQREIDQALQAWNGDMDSKRSVVRYFRDHERDKDTAQWLAEAYGDPDSRVFHIPATDVASELDLPWPKVQRRIAQLIRQEQFYTQDEYANLEDVDPIAMREDLAQAGIVGGRVVDPGALENDPFIQQVKADVARFAAEEAETSNAEPEIVVSELVADDIDDKVAAEIETLKAAFEAAGLHFDDINSYPGYLDFLEEGGTRYTFDSWTDARDWIEGVVFDDPARIEAAERVLYPERYENTAEVEAETAAEINVENGTPNAAELEGTPEISTAAEPAADSEVKDFHDLTTLEFAERYLIPGETTLTSGNRTFLVDRINPESLSINLQDITFTEAAGFPIFRVELISWARRLIEPELEAEYAARRVAEYPAEETGLPYTIEVQELHFPEQVQQTEVQTQNFHITDEHLGVGGPKAKFRANMDAINLLKELEFEGRQAAPEEQETLSRYVGWGGLSDAFDESKENWTSEYQELYNALTPEEYAAARASTLNAHYTSPTVIGAIYEAVGNLGFATGNILEPSMGVGNFFGCLPESMQSSKLYGVELDSLSGRIAKQLYPNAEITIGGFETTDRRDFYDLAIGNVPFGQYQVDDPAYNKLGFSIHDYFFTKALDQVRPGGVVAFVTSRYTLDKQSPEVRKYLAQRAELLGAIRLPNDAFKANAGTDVVSDIIFLQKRDSPIEIEPDWVYLDTNQDGFAINSYFVQHPEMVLGQQTSASTQYGREDFTVIPYEGSSLKDLLYEAVGQIQGTYQEAELPDLGEGEAIDTSIPADPNVRNYSYTVVDGEVYYRENSRMVKPDLNATAKERVKGLAELRDCTRNLIDLQLQPYTTDAEIQASQQELNRLYDSFTAKFGLINSRGNSLAFADDSSYYLLCSLEILDDDGNLKRKADMFSKRTIQPHEVVTSVDTAAEALAVSISEKARVDMDYMCQLTGMDEDAIASDLRGVIFQDFMGYPEGQYAWKARDEFLSGNVREKLAYYEHNAPKYEGTALHDSILYNIEALKSAQPKDLEASEIEARLGATWIDPQYIQQFMVETFQTPFYQSLFIKVNYSPYTAEWSISGKTHVNYSDTAARMTYGTERANAYKILEDTLNLRDVRIYDTIQDNGTERRVLNSKETTLAQQKQQAIKDAFAEWLWKDPNRRQTLVAKYNELFNSEKPREYNGDHITFAGMNPEITLREHQKNAIAHALYGGNTLLAHEVGSGKTFEIVATAMESKRLGLCQKSLIAVPNHLTEQWASEFLRLYPSANILVATKKDFEPQNRKKFCARIATGNYDAVIIGHSQFEKIPISKARQEQLLKNQIEEITDGITELKLSRGESFTIKSMEKTKRSLETKLKKLQSDARKDDVVTFEQLGVDRLFVDEAHAYKNAFVFSKMRNVAGISTSESQKASDMLMKCRYMDEITGGKGVIFATGTPVSNSMTELYVMMRYLQNDTLKRKGMAHFDCWAANFGETTTALELAPEGGYRAKTRFSKFFNLPELMTLFKEVADIKTADQLHLPTPEAVYHNVVAQPTETQQQLVQELSDRASRVHNRAVNPSEDNMLKITSDGRKLGLDQRIINPNYPDEPGTKVNLCVDNIYRIWDEGKADKLTQIVFCDLSTPKNLGSEKKSKTRLDDPELNALLTMGEDPEPEKEFCVYDDIRDKLVARGIPREEIVFIHEADTEAKKAALYSKVRSGQVRVLMGSTSKLGTGTNVQDRLVALHDLDAPWRPGDLEQRAGRIVRQGNQNAQVHIYRYVTEKSFDSFLWQTLENKQKFISQIMTSKNPVRTCEDVDETALSYAEIKALCAGDDRIKEKMALDVDVARLKLMKASHNSQQFRLQDNLRQHFPKQIEECKKYISGFEADLKTLADHPHPQEGFAGMEVRGDHLTDKENAGAALLDAMKTAKGYEPVPVGSYRGFSMALSLEDFGKKYILTLKGQMTHKVELGRDAKGNLTRIDNVLNGIQNRLDSTKGKLESLYVQQEAAKAELGKPFPQEAELQTKSARLTELNIALNIGDKTQEEAPIVEETKGKRTPVSLTAAEPVKSKATRLEDAR